MKVKDIPQMLGQRSFPKSNSKSLGHSSYVQSSRSTFSQIKRRTAVDFAHAVGSLGEERLVEDICQLPYLMKHHKSLTNSNVAVTTSKVRDTLITEKSTFLSPIPLHRRSSSWLALATPARDL